MKVNVVTGGGTGIGRAAAAMLPKDEKVVITGRRLEKLNKTAEELNAEGHQLVGMTCDVSKREDVKKLAEFAASLGDVSKVIPIDKLSVVITIVLAVFILHEKYTPKSVFGCVLITAGTLMMVL